jgi:predicted transcriptional regulator
MSPLLLTSAATLAEERDPIWEAMLASPIVEDDLSEDEQAAFEEGMADIRAGRVVSREKILETVERLRIEQGE